MNCTKTRRVSRLMATKSQAVVALLCNKSMVQPPLVARSCYTVINARSVALAMKKHQTARFIAKVQIKI
jgi:hypothetical protein